MSVDFGLPIPLRNGVLFDLSPLWKINLFSAWSKGPLSRLGFLVWKSKSGKSMVMWSILTGALHFVWQVGEKKHSSVKISKNQWHCSYGYAESLNGKKSSVCRLMRFSMSLVVVLDFLIQNSMRNFTTFVVDSVLNSHGGNMFKFPKIYSGDDLLFDWFGLGFIFHSMGSVGVEDRSSAGGLLMESVNFIVFDRLFHCSLIEDGFYTRFPPFNLEGNGCKVFDLCSHTKIDLTEEYQALELRVDVRNQHQRILLLISGRTFSSCGDEYAEYKYADLGSEGANLGLFIKLGYNDQDLGFIVDKHSGKRMGKVEIMGDNPLSFIDMNKVQRREDFWFRRAAVLFSAVAKRLEFPNFSDNCSLRLMHFNPSWVVLQGVAIDQLVVVWPNYLRNICGITKKELNINIADGITIVDVGLRDAIEVAFDSVEIDSQVELEKGHSIWPSLVLVYSGGHESVFCLNMVNPQLICGTIALETTKDDCNCCTVPVNLFGMQGLAVHQFVFVGCLRSMVEGKILGIMARTYLLLRSQVEGGVSPLYPDLLGICFPDNAISGELKSNLWMYSCSCCWSALGRKLRLVCIGSIKGSSLIYGT